MTRALHGIDIASWQQGISDATVNHAEVVIIKVTEGTSYVNPAARSQFDQAVRLGKKVGVYHFYNGANPRAQAEFFAAQTARLGTPDFFVLDFEKSEHIHDTAAAYSFMRRLDELVHEPVWFYTYANPLAAYGFTEIRDAGYPLWLAGYPGGEDLSNGFSKTRTLAQGWGMYGVSAKWRIAGWQYAETGRLPGWNGSLDFNLFAPDAPGIGGQQASTIYAEITPVDSRWTISQEFNGGRSLATNLGGGHTGIDYACPTGTDAIALERGTVVWADWAANLPRTNWADRWYLVGGGFQGLATDAGIVVVIEHGTYFATYSHMNRTDLNVGDKVVQGQVIGQTGYTGYTIGGGVAGMNNPAGAHLHFEVLPKPAAWGNGFYGRVNPRPYFQQTIESDGKLTHLAESDWLTMTSKQEIVDAIFNHPIDKEGGGKTTLATEVSWVAENVRAIRKDIQQTKNRVDIIWGGIFTDFSYSGKKEDNEPGIIRRLKAQDAKLAEVEKAAATVKTGNAGDAVAALGLTEDRLAELVRNAALDALTSITVESKVGL